MVNKSEQFINREISWLSFNERVLQEASDPTVPIIERIRFLGIFSSNQDEFFRVRFATIKRIIKYGGLPKAVLGGSPKTILMQIQKIVKDQHVRHSGIYQEILMELEKKHGIHKLNEKTLDPRQGEFVRSYFNDKVRSALTPIMIDSLPDFPRIKDKRIYLAVKLSKSNSEDDVRYSLIRVPTHLESRFLILPPKNGKKFFILLDDVIRYNLHNIFYIFDYDVIEAFTLKVSLDAELDIDNDVSKSFIELIAKSVKKRELANPVRLIYDHEIPNDLFSFVIKRLKLSEEENIIAGVRYHNFRDFMKFPDFALKDGLYNRLPALAHPDIALNKSMFSAISKKDIMLNFPYQSFQHVNDFLREAAIDPKVKSIKITLYRVAENSTIVNALINALRNGKDVTAVVELQARFDEKTNIYWANKLIEEGAKVIHGVKGLKVHCKLCLITRKESGKLVQYANIATGNYNEDTAQVYVDHSFFTADQKITREVVQMFNFFKNNLEVGRYKHLLVAPFNMRKKLIKLIKNEIVNAQNGKKAYILLKLNSLVDPVMIKKLYQASKAGVKIRMVVRGICSLIPGKAGLSENIQAVSIVDKYLEHSRMYIFCNGEDAKYYISSADWMTRNLDHRLEVSCPIYDKLIQKQLRDFMDVQLKDNVKARKLDRDQLNRYRKTKRNEPVRAQDAIYQHYVNQKNTAVVV